MGPPSCREAAEAAESAAVVESSAAADAAVKAAQADELELARALLLSLAEAEATRCGSPSPSPIRRGWIRSRSQRDGGAAARGVVPTCRRMDGTRGGRSWRGR